MPRSRSPTPIRSERQIPVSHHPPRRSSRYSTMMNKSRANVCNSRGCDRDTPLQTDSGEDTPMHAKMPQPKEKEKEKERSKVGPTEVKAGQPLIHYRRKRKGVTKTANPDQGQREGSLGSYRTDYRTTFRRIHGLIRSNYRALVCLITKLVFWSDLLDLEKAKRKEKATAVATEETPEEESVEFMDLSEVSFRPLAPNKYLDTSTMELLKIRSKVAEHLEGI